MCGGKGTRLKKNYPKILVKIKGKTILEHQLELANKNNFKKIILLTGYKSRIIEDFIKKKKLHKNIKIIQDKKKFGNGGALINSLRYLEEEFCLIYGDILTNISLLKMYSFYKRKNSDLCLVVNKNDNFKDSNLITFNKDKMINKFYFYPHKKIPKNCFSNEAIFMCKKKIFLIIKKQIFKKKSDFVKDIIPLLSSSAKIHAFETNEYIIDCGTPKRLKNSEYRFKSLIKK